MAVATMQRWSGVAFDDRRGAVAAIGGRWAVAALLGVLMGGCATPPASPPPPAPVPVSAPVEAPVSVPVCPPCDDQSARIARLQEELATRDAELRDLQAQHRDQAKALQETTTQAARAKVKRRRLATQVDAASYVAEVEVALETARAAPGAATRGPLLALAQDILQSSAAPFAQGDYGVAMDFAAQAEQLAAIAADGSVRTGTPARAIGEVRFDVAIRLRARIESNLRAAPGDKAPSIGVLQEGALLVGRAYRGGWLKVQTEDGRSGWMHPLVLGAR